MIRRRYNSDNDGDGAVPTTNNVRTRDGGGGGSKNEPRGEGTNSGRRRRYEEDNEDDKDEDLKASTHENQRPWTHDCLVPPMVAIETTRILGSALFGRWVDHKYALWREGRVR